MGGVFTGTPFIRKGRLNDYLYAFGPVADKPIRSALAGLEGAARVAAGPFGRAAERISGSRGDARGRLSIGTRLVQPVPGDGPRHLGLGLQPTRTRGHDARTTGVRSRMLSPPGQVAQAEFGVAVRIDSAVAASL